MVKFWLAGILFFVMVPPLFAQERVVDHYSVRLGLMSWESIQSEVKTEANSLSSYQRRMAKQMAAMHRGGLQGDYHVLVTIDDLVTGQGIKDAEVKIVVSGMNKQRETVTLEPMVMDGFAGYGEFIRFDFDEPYTLQISFTRASANEAGQVEFSSMP